MFQNVLGQLRDKAPHFYAAKSATDVLVCPSYTKNRAVKHDEVMLERSRSLFDKHKSYMI